MQGIFFPLHQQHKKDVALPLYGSCCNTSNAQNLKGTYFSFFLKAKHKSKPDESENDFPSFGRTEIVQRGSSPRWLDEIAITLCVLRCMQSGRWKERRGETLAKIWLFLEVCHLIVVVIQTTSFLMQHIETNSKQTD